MATGQEKAAALVHAVFKQLTVGCGQDGCKNQHCATGSGNPMPANTAAAETMKLVRELEDAALCKPGAPQSASGSGRRSSGSRSGSTSRRSSGSRHSRDAVMTLAKLKAYAADAPRDDMAALLRGILGAWSSGRHLDRSFLVSPDARAGSKDSGVDIAAVIEAYGVIYKAGDRAISTLTTAVVQLLGNGEYSSKLAQAAQVRHLLILLLNPCIHDPTKHDGRFDDRACRPLLAALYLLPAPQQRYLTSWLSQIPSDVFSGSVVYFQQFITLRLFAHQELRPSMDEPTHMATVALGLYASANKSRPVPRLPISDFYNDALYEALDLRLEYQIFHHNRGGGPKRFSFMEHSYVLNPEMKHALLTYGSAQRINQAAMNSVFSSLFSGAGSAMPYLVLRVRRAALIEDTLHVLEHTPANELPKPLKVVFDGEEGIDEGGVQKEFFQLVVKQLFDPAYGMFSMQEETRSFWFRADSLENKLEYQLIGTILGLAIYNGVILDIRFPRVVWRKLLGLKPVFADLEDAQPQLAEGLKKLLEFDGDVQETFATTFQVSYDAFGEVKTIDLKPNGGSIDVTNENRQEYVDLYVNWALNESIATAFAAFQRGFNLLCDTPEFRMFQPEEVELLVCGDPRFDLDDLAKVTKYENGYTKDSPQIRWLWETLRSLPVEDQRRFLHFATGSDRVPIGGLGKLAFTIVRHGDNQNHIPSSHTCFNQFLLPLYKSKELLAKKLRAALDNAEGFGLQ